ncbi:MAG: DotU family type IV/VI secretion system protein [Nannocystaceae bacterium]
MSSTDPRVEALRLAAPVVAAIEALPQSRDGAALERGRAAVVEAIDAFTRACAQTTGDTAARGAAYALVALADEVAMRVDGPLRDFWKPRTLQLERYGDNRAGYGLFTRKAALEAEAAAPPRDVALAIYVLALELGFEGRHADGASAGASALERELAAGRRALALGSPEATTVRALPRTGSAPRPRPEPPGPWLRIAAALFVGGLFFSARCALSDITADVEAATRALNTAAPPPRV